MSDHCQTVKVKPWAKSQGEYVLINEADFDPAVHELLDAPASTPDSNGDGKLSVAEIREALTAKGVTFDPKAKKADLQKLLDAAAPEA